MYQEGRARSPARCSQGGDGAQWGHTPSVSPGLAPDPERPLPRHPRTGSSLAGSLPASPPPRGGVCVVRGPVRDGGGPSALVCTWVSPSRGGHVPPRQTVRVCLQGVSTGLAGRWLGSGKAEASPCAHRPTPC